MKKLTIIYFILFLAVAVNAQTKKEIIHSIRNEANVAGIDPDLALAVAIVDSGLNPKAVGVLNEQGLFQLRPEYHKLNGQVSNNIKVGVKYLALLKSKSNGAFGNAWFVLFNYGPHNAPKAPEQTKYYKKVMREISKIKTERYLLAGNL